MQLFKLFSKHGPKEHRFEMWVKLYSSEFYRFAVLRVNSRQEAEDLLQQTFTNAYAALDSFAPGTSEKAWLYTILNNAIRDHLTKLSRRPVTVAFPDQDTLETLIDTKADPEAQLLREMDLEELEKALSALPEPFAAPLLMHAVGEMKYEDIAKTLSIPIGTVMSRLYRARKALFEILVNNQVYDENMKSISEKTMKNKGGEKDGLR